MSRRGVARINYSTLHSTGIVTPLVEDNLIQDLNNMTLDDGHPTNMEIQVMVLIDEIKDTIEENLYPSLTITEIDHVISKLENLREELRPKSHQLGSFDLPVSHTLDRLREYIINARDYKSKSHLQDERLKQDQQLHFQRSAIFSLANIDRQINELHDIFNANPADVTNDELIQWRSNHQTHLKQFEKIADSYKEVLKVPIKDADTMIDIKNISERFDKLSTSKFRYSRLLEEEIKLREPDKVKNFNKLSLNIKLEKFAGYDSNTDFYTFKSNFEKIHLHSTPKNLLPDLLKNNFLLDPALTLVKTINDIDSIWEQLETTYGDARIMLSKKLHQLTKFDSIKTSSSEKLMIALGKIINLLNDVTKLAAEHHVEDNLYYGDSLSKFTLFLVTDVQQNSFHRYVMKSYPQSKHR